MRGGSLSHAKVVELLNAYFVPVYTSNEDYRDGGAAPPDERAELRRIQQEGYRKKLSVGTVRQPRTRCPSSRVICSKMISHWRRSSGSVGR